jgi:hypothetical protein
VGDKLTKISEYLATIDAVDEMGDLTEPYWAVFMDPEQSLVDAIGFFIHIMGIIDGVDEAIEAIDEQAGEGLFDRAKKVKAAMAAGATRDSAVTAYTDVLKAEIRETSALKAGAIAGLMITNRQHHNDDIHAHE